jgi:lactate dehydrogenase-like 2-hydroxyacid dehydrogenase
MWRREKSPSRHPGSGNNDDLAAADRLGIVVLRILAYSPDGVAEHAVALVVTLNRQTQRADDPLQGTRRLGAEIPVLSGGFNGSHAGGLDRTVRGRPNRT